MSCFVSIRESLKSVCVWVTYLTPRSLFCVSFAVPLSAESSDCAALFLLRQLSFHYQYNYYHHNYFFVIIIHSLSLLAIRTNRSLLFNSLKVSNIFNSIIIYKLPTVVEAKPSGPSCVYCWPSGWLMAKPRELDMRRNGMQTKIHLFFQRAPLANKSSCLL